MMNSRKWASCIATVILMLNGATAARSAATEVWLGGEDPTVQQDKHKSDPADYMAMFQPNAPWSDVARTLTAFKISTQFAFRGNEEQVRTVIKDLQRRHIGLAIELGVLAGPGPGGCGYHVEGYGSPAGVEAVARRIKSLGGRIDYVAMDEPVWFGHVFQSGSDGRIGCRDAVADLAAQVAPKVAILRHYFPDIRIGDIEPVSARSPQFIDDVISFADLLNQKTGIKLAFVHADIAWKTDWQPMLEQLANQLHARQIPFGVICDGDKNAGGDQAWVDQALQRCQAIAADPHTKPDEFIVQSWEPLPTKMLPETDPGALTYEAKQIITLFH